MANTYIYIQMSCVAQNVIVFHTCAQNCYCLSMIQQLEMELGVVLVHFEVAQVEALLLFPFHSVLSGKAEAAQGRSFPLFSFVFFFPEGVASGRSPEAAFHNLKNASRQILQIPVCMEQHHSTGCL